jgi:hypothetical protein
MNPAVRSRCPRAEELLIHAPNKESLWKISKPALPGYGYIHLLMSLTTRQTFQMHGVHKNPKTVLSTVIKNMGSTSGACGDLNRNVLAPAAPYVRKDVLFAQQTAENIAALLTPQSGAYYDLWVDGEKIMSAEEKSLKPAMTSHTEQTSRILLNQSTTPSFCQGSSKLQLLWLVITLLIF